MIGDVLFDDNLVPRLQEFPGFLMRCASDASDAAFYEAHGKVDITPRQFAVLLTLRDHGPCSQRQISALTRIDSSTINEMIGRMTKRGLVASSKSKTDRRSMELSLTSEGLRRCLELLPRTIEAQRNLIAVIPAEYRRILLHSLGVIIESRHTSTPNRSGDA